MPKRQRRNDNNHDDDSYNVDDEEVDEEEDDDDYGGIEYQSEVIEAGEAGDTVVDESCGVEEQMNVTKTKKGKRGAVKKAGARVVDVKHTKGSASRTTSRPNQKKFRIQQQPKRSKQQQQQQEEVNNDDDDKNDDEKSVVEVAEDLKGPTYERLTVAGGYAHVVSTKLLISQRNKGKVPWNKGKTRNSTDRAKIAAGVRARNNAVEKKRLEAYGITPEQAKEYRQKIKYIRERVRRARKDNDARIDVIKSRKLEWKKIEQELKEKRKIKEALLEKEQQEQQQEQQHRANVEEYTWGRDSIDNKEDQEEEEEEEQDEEEDEEEEEPIAANTSAAASDQEESDTGEDSDASNEDDEDDDDDDNDDDDDDDEDDENDADYKALNIFAREFDWIPHPWDDNNNNQNSTACSGEHPTTTTTTSSSYQHMCPSGGPGGLICCETCADLYAQYMFSTFSQLERQKISKVGKELDELQGFLATSTRRLDETVRVARRKPIPLRPRGGGGGGGGVVGVTRTEEQQEQLSQPSESTTTMTTTTTTATTT